MFTFLWLNVHTEATIGSEMLRALPIVFISMAGFAMNDVWDADKDRIAGKLRPIAMMKITKGAASCIAAILIFAAILLGLAVGTTNSVCVLIIVSAGVLLYSPFAQSLPLWKNIYTAFLCSSPLVYSAVLSHVEVKMWLFVIWISFLFGRELLLDVYDSVGDQRAGLRTIAVVVGRSRTTCMAFGVMAIAMAAMSFAISGIPSIVLFAFAISSMVAVGGLWMGRLEESAIVLSRLTLLLGAVAIAFSAAL
jgi:4-hydroxybenzoate polyprenyltransferase